MIYKLTFNYQEKVISHWEIFRMTNDYFLFNKHDVPVPTLQY
jgi:hypothetical protein